MAAPARKLRDTYAITPGAPLVRREFGYMEGLLDRWRAEGLPADADLAEVFGYDPPGGHGLSGLGWCEAAFSPAFEEKVIEVRGGHEVVQDFAGRHLLVFAGRRQGFMPEYLDHPVKDMATWEERCKWRLDPSTPARWEGFEERMEAAKAAAATGMMITQRVVGPYMYLRSLIGPEGLLYAFYDMPEVIHDCMRTWLSLADAVITRHQAHVTLDEIFFAEDICYNHGPLISPEMMKRFLLPYARQLVDDVKARQLDRGRHLYVQIDTDGYATSVIDVYREAIGMDAMSPFEVASGCDVVAIGRAFPELAIFGGIDKRVLARGRKAIDEHVERILPAMRRRGGYIPTSDHAVPVEVPLADYMHYRKRCIELGG
jgi:uroporphyrinogen decarboxylase